MSIVLPNSIFYHVGRTGGHWVSHVLWQAGLVERRLYPLHLTPAQANIDGALNDKPFRFCFVRHPLKWLASLWMHEMEFGWADSEISTYAASDNFADFLAQLLEKWPQGPVSHAMTPYTDPCNFVGRTEALAHDLGVALSAAKETFDPAVLIATPPINETSLNRLRDAARAPADLLAAVMASEGTFNRRFGYEEIPGAMIGGPAAPIWPLLRVQPDEGKLARAHELGLVKPRFDYRFDDGSSIHSEGHERATQWALIDTVQALPQGSKCAVVSESDPYFAYLAANHGCAPVTFVNGDDAVTSPFWRDRLAAEIESTSLEKFLTQHEPTYDALVFCDSLEISLAAEMEFIHAALVLKPDGVLIFTAPVLHTDLPIKVIWSVTGENHGRKLAYYSLGYIRALLAAVGLASPDVIRMIYEQPADSLAAEVVALAQRLSQDSDRILGKAILRTRLGLADDATLSRDALIKLWLLRRPSEFLNTAADGLPRAAHATIAMLKADLAQERGKRAAAEQGMADRERELVQARVTVAALANDADYSRDQIARARAETESALLRLQALSAQIEFLGVSALGAKE